MKKAAKVTFIATMLLSLLPFSAFAAGDTLSLGCPMKHLGFSEETLNGVYAALSVVPGFVYAIVFLGLVVLWIVEMTRKNGCLRIGKLASKQPCALFFELAFFFTYSCSFLISRGNKELFHSFTDAIYNLTLFRNIASDECLAYLFPLGMVVFGVLWLILELFADRPLTLIPRVTFKLALLISAVLITNLGVSGTAIIYILLDVRVAMYAVAIVYAVINLFNLTAWYVKTPAFIAKTVIGISNYASRGFGDRLMYKAISKRYGTEAARAFFEIDNHAERVGFLAHLKRIVGK